MTNINDCEKIFNAIERSSNFIKGNAKNKRLKEWMTLGLLKSV